MPDGLLRVRLVRNCGVSRLSPVNASGLFAGKSAAMVNWLARISLLLFMPIKPELGNL